MLGWSFETGRGTAYEGIVIAARDSKINNVYWSYLAFLILTGTKEQFNRVFQSINPSSGLFQAKTKKLLTITLSIKSAFFYDYACGGSE